MRRQTAEKNRIQISSGLFKRIVFSERESKILNIFRFLFIDIVNDGDSVIVEREILRGRN